MFMNQILETSQFARATEDHHVRDPALLPFRRGEVIRIVERNSNGWFLGECNGRKGQFPRELVQILFDAPGLPSPALSVNTTGLQIPGSSADNASPSITAVSPSSTSSTPGSPEKNPEEDGSLKYTMVEFARLFFNDDSATLNAAAAKIARGTIKERIGSLSRGSKMVGTISKKDSAFGIETGFAGGEKAIIAKTRYSPVSLECSEFVLGELKGQVSSHSRLYSS
jgi:hypothetical protein